MKEILKSILFDLLKMLGGALIILVVLLLASVLDKEYTKGIGFAFTGSISCTFAVFVWAEGMAGFISDFPDMVREVITLLKNGPEK